VSGRPSNRPPSAEGPAGDEPPPSHEAHDPRPSRTIDGILPELIRRGLEVGREKVSESIPRELAAQVVAQLGDVRSGVVKAVAQEVGRFLREADIASEIRKVLTGLNVEAKVRLGFSARDDGTVKIKPEVDVKLGEDADRATKRPPPKT
jgi:hypothetical protein